MIVISQLMLAVDRNLPDDIPRLEVGEITIKAESLDGPLPELMWRARLHGHLLEPVDQPDLDQHAIEASRFGPFLAPIEQAVATLQDLLLFLERRIERNARRLQQKQRQIGSVE